MRRKAKYIFADPEPGTTRLKRVFAWKPTEIDGTVVWLEYFEILEAFIIFTYNVVIDGEKKSAKVGTWTELSKRVMK